ncbi:MAG: UDP-3-O-(3-hydroxymyristoyl)glucosamine N-acyltransferase [Bacteroidetes bacterium]|nr:UDP-3-O-(3-hydroxymyristoyl)glucosamine N-acyltransferase [Bacteroidota bacterium]
MKLSELADFLGGKLDGDPELEVSGIAKIEDAGSGQITFISNPKYEKFLSTTEAEALICSPDIQVPSNGPKHIIRVSDPYSAFLFTLERFNPPMAWASSGIHPTAIIDSTARLGSNVTIGPGVVIYKEAKIGNNCRIHANSVIGPAVSMGEDCLLYPNVTVYHQVQIHNRVIIHSGAVIGSDGFGFVPGKDGSYRKIPQMGFVILEDDVEIGSNTSIDRATLGATVVKHGSKLDNLIQIAHNVNVGENTVMAAQVGIAGSVKVGANCQVGGQVGIAGHLEVANNINIGAQSGVSKSLTLSGTTYFGTPAKPIKEAFRMEGAMRQLPSLFRQIKELEDKVAALEAKSGEGKHQ